MEFVTPENVEFPALVQEIQKRPPPIGPPAVVDRDSAAVVLLNQSGKAIIALSYVWKYTTASARVHPNCHSNLGSSMLMDVLTGRSGVIRDRFSFILPGSKRLITEDGIFGDSFDVLGPEPAQRGAFGGVGAAAEAYVVARMTRL